MARRNSLFSLIAILGTIVALVYFFNTYPIPLLSASAGPDFIGIIVGLLFTTMGILSVSEVKDSPAVVGSLSVTGVGFAFLLGELYNVGVITATALGDWTLYNVQFSVIVICFILGVIIYARGR